MSENLFPLCHYGLFCVNLEFDYTKLKGYIVSVRPGFLFVMLLSFDTITATIALIVFSIKQNSFMWLVLQNQ